VVEGLVTFGSHADDARRRSNLPDRTATFKHALGRGGCRMERAGGYATMNSLGAPAKAQRRSRGTHGAGRFGHLGVQIGACVDAGSIE